jgi:hypothetical protein
MLPGRDRDLIREILPRDVMPLLGHIVALGLIATPVTAKHFVYVSETRRSVP